MNFRFIFKILGMTLIAESIAMFAALLVAFFTKSPNIIAFALSVIITGAVGGGLQFIKPRNTDLYQRDGYAVVGLAWLLISFFGALPFALSGVSGSFINAFFEAAAGFTTTSATTFADVEILAPDILFWRSFTNWLGGVGVIIMLIAVFPSFGVRSFHMVRAESTGPAVSRLVPKVNDTARIIYTVYLSLTLVQIILLMLTGMPLFDAIIVAFSTAATGGFSAKSESIGGYGNNAAVIIVTVFMLIFSINFSLLFLIWQRKFDDVRNNSELRMFMLILIAAVVLISVDLWHHNREPFGDILLKSVFQTVSFVSTTGFFTADIAGWPTMSRFIILALMVIGASAGSTAGGIKIARLSILLKSAKKEIDKNVRPRQVKGVKINGRVVEDDVVSGVLIFFFIYVFIIAVSVIIVSFENIDIETTFSSVFASISNAGVGLGKVGPLGNYSFFSPMSKIVLCFNMIVGRLEIIPLLIVIMPGGWKR